MNDKLVQGMNTGAEMIAAERKRQIGVEGWTAEHDAQHMSGDLLDAGSCYALVAVWQLRRDISGWTEAMVERMVEDRWPWDDMWWKPSDDPVRNLVKAGALIAAEIDRLQAERVPSTLES